MAADVSNQAQCATLVDMEEIALKVQPLPEKTLRAIAKGPLVKFTLACQDVEKVTRVWQSLIDTLSTASLSPGHSAEVCNVTSAFIDAASKSQCDAVKQLVLSEHVWLSLFNICLIRYEDAKPKPIKLILSSITALLAKGHQGNSRASIQATVADAILPSILLGEPQSRLKGSLVFLETFIRKGAILPSELISLLRGWLSKNEERWAACFSKDHGVLSLCESEHTLNSTADNLSDELVKKILVLRLLIQTSNKTMATPAGSLLAILIQKMKPETPSQKLSEMWVTIARRLALENVATIEELSNRLLQPLFTADPNGFKMFLETLPLKSLVGGDMTDVPEAEYMVLFAALQVGKKINLVQEDYVFDSGKLKNDSNDILILKSEVIGKFLLQRKPSIRIAALSLLITTPSTIKPFTFEATQAILRGLPCMHAESEAHTRGEILSMVRRFIMRLKGGIVREEDAGLMIQKSVNKPAAGKARNETMTKDFLKAYLNLLQNDLPLSASYARHITALKSIRLLLDSGLDPRTNVKPQKSEFENVWKVQIEVFDANLLRLLVDLLLDRFEEVRETSLAILNLCPREILLDCLQHTTRVGMRLTDALTRVENLASNTSRADHADTVARLYHLIFCAALPGDSAEKSSDWWSTKASVVDTILNKLEERLLGRKGLFHSFMREAPLHGYTSGLRYIVLMPNFHTLIASDSGATAWRSVHERIEAICDKIWQEAKPFLCVDSPEGHTDEPIGDLDMGPKDALSYSWRSLRESSILLHATLFNTSYGPNGAAGLNRDDFAKIGGASFTQLAELRHRGAFTNVAQTFATCCQRCSSSKDAAIRELSRGWYQEAKSTIFDSASKLTRRSAGIPALVTGTVGSDPATPFFEEALNELHEISYLPVEYDKERQYLELPQVHAMNCLKDIFTNNKLSTYTEPFIMKALTLSADRLGSPIWALRNSGLMLFRALLTRMCRAIPGAVLGFGGLSGAEPGSRITFPKYPGLLELLSGLLTTAQGGATEGTDIITEKVFPALELVGDKIPSLDDATDDMLRGLVLQHLGSSVWGVREHAARVFASLLPRQRIPDAINDLAILPENPTENYIHGVALTVRYALRRYTATDNFWMENMDGFFETLRAILDILFRVGKSPTVAAELVEILNGLLERAIQAENEEKIASFTSDMSQSHDLNGILQFVFDASHAGWNFSTTTRACALLRRALSWFKVLKMLTTQQWEELPLFFQDISQFDADIARWVVEMLHEFIGDDVRYMKPLSDLYVSVILGTGRPDVKSVAASNLSFILESVLSSQLSAASSIDLPWEAIASAFKPEKEIEIWNREATDAELRLCGCLLAMRTTLNNQNALSSFENDIHRWATKLRSALSEETEFTTRFAAVTSVSSFSRAIRPPGAPPRIDAILFDVYLVLYDMLNDDDDEIRDIAASTASWVLSHSSVSPDADVTLAPLNASALLADFVTYNYTESPILGRRVLLYLTGQEPRISGSDDGTCLIPVSDWISRYRQDSTVLFEEEKQNLFINDVREVKVWSRSLMQLSKLAYEDSAVREISLWASEGLLHLRSLVSPGAEPDGLMGWVSKPEIFALGCRVITIASILDSRGFLAELLHLSNTRDLLTQLQSLGEEVSLHGQWLALLSKALE